MSRVLYFIKKKGVHVYIFINWKYIVSKCQECEKCEKVWTVSRVKVSTEACCESEFCESAWKKERYNNNNNNIKVCVVLNDIIIWLY